MDLKKTVKIEIFKNIVLFVVICILFVFTYNVGILNNVKVIQNYMKALILITLCIFIIFCIDKRRTKPNIISFIIILGLIMRIGYMLYTASYVRGHDVGKVSLDSYGHFSYIYRIYENLKLPDINRGQLYHPPLYHILSAIMMYLIKPFTVDHDVTHLIEAAKIISCFASCATLRICYFICKELNLSNKVSYIVMAFLAFLPNMYLLAGRVNNDSLVIFFMFAIILFTLRWYKDRSYVNSIILALLYGLGMSTKISCGILAIFTGSLMIIAFLQDLRHGSGFQNFKRLLCFGVLCFPLGLWYPIRNFILFRQPFNYVLEISRDHDLYCGDWSFFDRFINLPLKSLFHRTYNLPYDDYNTNIYLIRGALFGEFTFDINIIIPRLLILVYLIILTFSMISMVLHFTFGMKLVLNRTIFNKTLNERFVLIGLPMLWSIIMLSYLGFNIRYPFGCTMDYRYIVSVALINAVFLGISYGNAGNIIVKVKLSIYKKLMVLYMRIVEILVILFSALSIIMFCNI